MNDQKTKKRVDEPCAQPQEQPARCQRCGQLNAEHELGNCTLCTDCYYLYGSCCLEFGADDLWRDQTPNRL